MKFEQDDWRYINGGLAIGLLVLYFLGVSLFGESLVVPYAFLWLMWVLNGIRSNGEKQKQTMAALEKRLEQVEAR
jgi:hypothetical protein